MAGCTVCYGMHVIDAWLLGYQGQGVTVAIVDTGVDVTHEDLKQNIVSDFNYEK